MTYCRRHGTGFEHPCPHTPTPAEMRDMVQEDATRGSETHSSVGAGVYTSERSEAVREPHSKPRVWHRQPHRVVRGRVWVWRAQSLWVIDLRGCCGDNLERYAGTQPEAMDAALAHVRDHHEPKASKALPKEPPKESILRLEPAVKDQLQAVLDRFHIPYREHHDDGRVVYKNYAAEDPVALTAGCKPHQPFIDAIRNYRPDPDPSSEDWRELIDRAHNGSRADA